MISNLKEGPCALREKRVDAHTPAVNEDTGLPVVQELKLLREENASLHMKIEEIEGLFIVADKEAEERWAQRQAEYDSLLEEKTEVIRALHHKNAELRERLASAGAGHALSENAPPPDIQELQRLQREIEEGRRQLVEDEQTMMGQLRQMEMSLAKDRAELSRQKLDLQRLQDEVKRELEVAARDGGLRDRLGALRRRATTATVPRGSASREAPPSASPPPPGVSDKPTKSGIFRRIFGAGQ